MKKIYYLFIGLIAGGAVSVAALTAEIPVKQSVKTKAPSFATSSPSVVAFRVFTFDGLGDDQGVCLKIRDTDGVGFTYLTTQNGTGSFSKTSCE